MLGNGGDADFQSLEDFGNLSPRSFYGFLCEFCGEKEGESEILKLDKSLLLPYISYSSLGNGNHTV